MIRPAASGSTPFADETATYGGTDSTTRVALEPKAIGGAIASTFARSASAVSVPNVDGWRNPTPYSGTLTKSEGKRVNYAYKIATGTFFGRNSFQPGITNFLGLPAFPGLCANDLSRARNKALLKLKDQTVNLSVAFAERQDTIDMVTDSFKRIARTIKEIKIYLKMRKRSPKKAKARIRRAIYSPMTSMPNDWLLYRYGILPTMLDVYGTLEALEKRDNGHYDRYMVTVRGKSTTVLPRVLKSSVYTTVGRYYPTKATVQRWQLPGSYGARVRYDAALTNSLYLRLSEAGVVNPLELLWEATTLSFVADWALSVGDFFAAIDATLPFTFIGGTETSFVKWSGETRFIGEGITIVQDTGPAVCTRFDRRVVSSFPFPTPFVLKQNPMNVTRFADALSLLVSLCR